ncbi:TPA: hypothetical protein ACX3KD_004529 [Raoultella ornithinolytica]
MNNDGLTLNQLAERNAVLVSEVEKLRAERDQLTAENVVRQEFVKICFRAAADGASLDGADIQEVGERLGLFGRETYQPVLHGYICGHEAGEDSVYVMKSSPATDRIVAGIKADGVEEWVSSRGGRWNGTTEEALKFAKQLREGAK